MNTPDLRDFDFDAHERRAQALRQQTIDCYAARAVAWVGAALLRLRAARGAACTA
jgi:hypothetical protein